MTISRYSVVTWLDEREPMISTTWIGPTMGMWPILQRLRWVDGSMSELYLWDPIWLVALQMVPTIAANREYLRRQWSTNFRDKERYT